jgi:AcrR family transcriptional regulator
VRVLPRRLVDLINVLDTIGLLCKALGVTKTNAEPAVDAKRQRLLEVAMATFLRHGFRKTSMEEVARAAHISRQGLYLHFPTKEELFAAAARYRLDSSVTAAADALARGATIEEKLVGAFDEWAGRYAGAFAGNVADLEDAGEHLVGDLIREREEAFVALITKAVRAFGLPAAYKDARIGARELAETLNATAAGLKHQARSREEFRRRFGVAVRALCTPLHRSQ